MEPNRTSRLAARRVANLLLPAAVIAACLTDRFDARTAVGDDSYAKNAARLQEMTAEQKEDLRRKKNRFDELQADEKQNLRELHKSITTDTNAKELSETVTRYNRWLASLDPTEKSLLLDIKDPAARIARIKELMQQQEERRFRLYSENLPDEDRKAVYKWLTEFVEAHATEIREKLPGGIRQRIDDAGDDEAKRRELFGSWQRWRRDYKLPFPVADDYSQLLNKLSAETQKQIESEAAGLSPDQKHERQLLRLEELVRIALYSRFFPQPSQEELLRFYASIKTDDPRRKQLDGKEGEELRRELQRMYNWERGYGRGGPPGPPGSRGFGPGRGRPDDRGGKPGDRFEGKDRGGKPPPADAAPPVEATPPSAESKQP
jgi:hypothetical protein